MRGNTRAWQGDGKQIHIHDKTPLSKRIKKKLQGWNTLKYVLFWYIMAKLLVILSVNVLYIFELSLCSVWFELVRVFCFTWKWKWLQWNQVSSHQFSTGASDKQLVHLKCLVFTKFSCILILWNLIWAFEQFQETRATCFGSPDFSLTWFTQRFCVFWSFNENPLYRYDLFPPNEIPQFSSWRIIGVISY